MFLAAVPFLGGRAAAAGGTAAGTGIAGAIFTAIGIGLAPLAINILTDSEGIPAPISFDSDDTGDNDGNCPVPCKLIEDIVLGDTLQPPGSVVPVRQQHVCIYDCGGFRFSRVIDSLLGCPKDANPREDDPTTPP